MGITTTSLSRRITMHLQNGAIKSHFQEHHNSQPTRECLVQNITILNRVKDKRRLTIAEALLIKENKPELNTQQTSSDRVLKLLR